jgi:hypothetical protein
MSPTCPYISGLGQISRVPADALRVPVIVDPEPEIRGRVGPDQSDARVAPLLGDDLPSERAARHLRPYGSPVVRRLRESRSAPRA